MTSVARDDVHIDQIIYAEATERTACNGKKLYIIHTSLESVYDRVDLMTE